MSRLLPAFPVVAAVAVCAVAAAPGVALAINGAQPGGIGVKNAAMGGASIALPLDAVAAANNPAGMAFVRTSAAVDAQMFRGNSSSDYVLPGNHLENRQTAVAPEAGYNQQLSPAWTAGFSLASAGVGSDYKQPALPVPGAGNAKTSLRVAELVPTVAWKPRADLALGVGLNIAYERFEADGVVVPAPVPGGLAPVPTHGKQAATGAGLRAGFLWKPTSELSFGGTAKSRTRMSKLDGYDQDLLSYSEGRIDLPPQYGFGVAWMPTQRLTIAADWLRILWGDIKVMQDPNGFHWRNQPVYRAGVAWEFDPSWTLRAGLSRNRGQIESDRTVQNLLVPSIHEKAYTAGIGFRAGRRSEISLGYELNPRTTLVGTGPSTGTSLTSQVQMFMLGYQYSF
ncbi:MAG TPA: outer membrane protein transport protein [Burkholderiaceae bacterium]|nr:outer membrane protein transport protein [Burkholderiaceae bacterium]